MTGQYVAQSPAVNGNVQIDGAFLMRGFGGPSSPSVKALQEHAPGQSLPGGLASALSRLHMGGEVPRPSGMPEVEVKGGKQGGQVHVGGGKDEAEDEGIFSMDG
jgi:cleavage and polyadenylation specificity factor subunit 4